MIFTTKSITKEYVISDKIDKVSITNHVTGKTIEYANPNEFVIGFNMRKYFTKIEYFGTVNCKLVKVDGDVIYYKFMDCLTREWSIKLFNNVCGDVIKTWIEFSCVDHDVIIDSVEYINMPIVEGKFTWTKPILTEHVHIPPYWATLGQPVYYDSLFMGVEFPTADNQILAKKTSLKIYYGTDVAAFGDIFKAHTTVIGASRGDDMEAHKYSFFKYVDTFARPRRFRMQYNSWYDNMLDITPQNIEESFRAVHKGFSESGLRDIDCYVVDDGWVDYRKAEFWAFNDKFKDGFDKEAKLTAQLNSTFGVWFGPRGGYCKDTAYFAKQLEKIGYHHAKKSNDICVADPHYIDSLSEKMIEFMKNYNVTYFKIDGFCNTPCPDKKHGHVVGGYKDLYFYTNLWINWFEAFDRMRKVNKDIFLNITSYSNVSPWMLHHADALWMNNAGDMAYEGEGSSLNQCLNYRDGRYYNLFDIRQLQFPNAYIYNHEPCYAERNYNPPLPHPAHKTVVYTDAEFEQYLTMCMMRGSGFIEMYYSPSMFSDAKWKINADVLKWAEDNFDALSQSIYFGGIPKNGDVYGYICDVQGEGYLAIRNPKSKPQSYTLDTQIYTHLSRDMQLDLHYGDMVGVTADKSVVKFELRPFEMKVIKYKVKK